MKFAFDKENQLLGELVYRPDVSELITVQIKPVSIKGMILPTINFGVSDMPDGYLHPGADIKQTLKDE